MCYCSLQACVAGVQHPQEAGPSCEQSVLTVLPDTVSVSLSPPQHIVKLFDVFEIDTNS